MSLIIRVSRSASVSQTGGIAILQFNKDCSQNTFQMQMPSMPGMPSLSGFGQLTMPAMPSLTPMQAQVRPAQQATTASTAASTAAMSKMSATTSTSSELAEQEFFVPLRHIGRVRSEIWNAFKISDFSRENSGRWWKIKSCCDDCITIWNETAVLVYLYLFTQFIRTREISFGHVITQASVQ